MDGRAWRATVYEVTKGQTRRRDDTAAAEGEQGREEARG